MHSLLLMWCKSCMPFIQNYDGVTLLFVLALNSNTPTATITVIKHDQRKPTNATDMSVLVKE